MTENILNINNIQSSLQKSGSDTGIIAGIYLMFTDSFATGLMLVISIATLHWVFSMLTNFSMCLHQKTLSQSELENMAATANLGFMKEASPRAWGIIANISAVLFWITASGIIVWFFDS